MTPLKFPGPVDSRSASWSPTMLLLLTTGAAGKTVALHRPREGHIVWELDELPAATRCCGVVWAPDGKRVGVLTTGSQCLVYDVNSGRLLATVAVKDDVGIGKWVGVGADADTAHGRAKFQGLSGGDILKALPRLLPLPTSFNGPLKFGTRQHIDALIQSHGDGEDELDILFLFGGNAINLTVNSLLTVGGMHICDDEHEIVDHVSIDEHNYVLTSSLVTMKHSLQRFQMKLDTPYLNKICISVSKTIALLGYIDEVLNFLSQESKNFLDFNNKFLGILKDELDKKNESVSDELYNLLLTGMMNDDVKDWLENTIADRGVKRWEKLGEVTFDNVRRTIIYHLIPACERLIILLSDLKSICEILLIEQEENDMIPLINESLKSVKEYLNSIFQFIIKINREQELFNSFISWVNFVLIELQEEDPTSKYQYKTSEVSQFIINNHLERSILFMLIPTFRRSLNQVKINSSDLFDCLKRQIREKLVKDDMNIELGEVSDHHQISSKGNELYVVTKHESHLEVFKVDIVSFLATKTVIQFNQPVTDFNSNDEQIIALTNSQLKAINFSQLGTTNTISGDDISTTIVSSIEDLTNPTNLSINFNEKIACIISSDLQTYQIIDL